MRTKIEAILKMLKITQNLFFTPALVLQLCSWHTSRSPISTLVSARDRPRRVVVGHLDVVEVDIVEACVFVGGKILGSGLLAQRLPQGRIDRRNLGRRLLRPWRCCPCWTLRRSLVYRRCLGSLDRHGDGRLGR